MINAMPSMRHLALPHKPTAPFLWYGGKGKLVKWILPWVKWGKVYCEPFCGAASVFWHKQPHPVDVLNDLNGDVVNTFRCLQDPKTFKELAHRIAWTPYSRAEFCRALETLKTSNDPVERAWAFMVAQGQGFGGRAGGPGDWGRVLFELDRGMAITASRWRGRIALLRWWHDRLTRVQLDNRDALEAIQYWDSPETIFYLDPPYPPETRVRKQVYRYEMTDNQHEQMLKLLVRLQGQAVLSTYPNELYESYLRPAGWKELRKETACHAAGRVRGSCLRGNGSARKHVPRTEVLWISPGLAEAKSTLDLETAGGCR